MAVRAYSVSLHRANRDGVRVLAGWSIEISEMEYEATWSGAPYSMGGAYMVSFQTRNTGHSVILKFEKP